MATVTGMTAAAMEAIQNATVVSGVIDPDGHLTLTQFDGTVLDAGYFPPADTSTSGFVELATLGETNALTDGTRAVTPASLATLAGRITALEVSPLSILTQNGLNEAALLTSYPVGSSLMILTTSSGWSINSGFGSVVTNRYSSGTRGQQTFYSSAGGTSLPQMWLRAYDASNGGGGWTAWVLVPTVATLTASSFTQASLYTAYPQGTSRLYYASGSTTGWDFSPAFGEVVTYVDGTLFAKQTFRSHVGGANATAEWIRTATSGGGWSTWEKLTQSSDMALIPTRIYTSTASISAVANTRVTLAVLFPVGRFTATPSVQVTANSGTPENVVGLTVTAVSATGFTISIYRTDTVVTTIYWQAMQN